MSFKTEFVVGGRILDVLSERSGGGGRGRGKQLKAIGPMLVKRAVWRLT